MSPRDHSGAASTVEGRARIARRTKQRPPLLPLGEVAATNHEDLDRAAAHGLAAARRHAGVMRKYRISSR